MDFMQLYRNGNKTVLKYTNLVQQHKFYCLKGSTLGRSTAQKKVENMCKRKSRKLSC